MFLRRVAAVLSLCGLLATNCVAYTSLCAVLCASRAAVRGSSSSSVSHHHHDSAPPAARSSASLHARHHIDMQQVIGHRGMVAVNSAPCAQYQAVIALLDGSRTGVGEVTFRSSRLANLPVAPVTPNLAAILLQADSPSPPQSRLLHLSAPLSLRI